MASGDTLDKIIRNYFAAVTKQEYSYKGKRITPSALAIYPSIASEVPCHENCGACCIRFSLDYIPSEKHPDSVVERQIEFNGKKYKILSDMQEDNDRAYCKYLDENASCQIHSNHPFSCDFELLKAFPTRKLSRILCTPFERAHRMARVPYQHLRPKSPKEVVPKEYRPLCKAGIPTQHGAEETIRKLRRLKEWTDYFGLETYLPEILEHLEAGGWKRDRATFGQTETWKPEIIDHSQRGEWKGGPKMLPHTDNVYKRTFKYPETDLLQKMIEQGVYTRHQLMEALQAKHPGVTRSTLATFLDDARNPKYSLFDKRIIVDASGVWRFASD